MSDYFKRFMQQTRLKVDREMAGRWEYSARYDGDKNIKTQMATARRTATTLEKSVGQFSNLRPEQELAIKAAASAMRSLANDLQGLATWAKAFKTFADAEYKKDRAAELEAIAVKRWGNDAEAFVFECSLIDELLSNDGRVALGQWMHARGECIDTPVDRFYSPFDSGVGALDRDTPRVKAASRIEKAVQCRKRDAYSWTGKRVCCSWQDYEAYLAHRKAVACATARAIQTAAQQ